MALLKQSSAAQPLMFLMIDSGDHITPKTGLSPTVTLSKAGGSFASPSGSVTEVANGWYKVAGNATDSGTLGPLVLHAEASGADPVDVVYEVVGFDPQDSIRMGLTALPSAAADAAGGLPISDAGGLDLDALLSRLDAAITTRSTLTQSQVTGGAYALQTDGSGYLKLSSGTGTGQVSLSSGLVTLADTQAFSNTGTWTGDIVGTLSTLTTYTGDTPQTGDAYARIGSNGAGLTALAPASTALSSAVWTNIKAGYIDAEISDGAAAVGFLNRVLIGDSQLTRQAAGGGASTITLQSIPDGAIGSAVVISVGVGVGQRRTIVSISGVIATVDIPWDVQPTTSSYYNILPQSAPAIPANYVATSAVASVTGNVGGSVGNVLALANNSITAASIATDAIDATSLKADAVAKIVAALAIDGLAFPDAMAVILAGLVGNTDAPSSDVRRFFAQDGTSLLATATYGGTAGVRTVVIE